ncbi:MAG: sugar phosphate isomerase/epimerase [Spirochaetaceae bacterium]|nr:sugar phosphate isomerase/epimerase [Spirochaetaceae bacterium]
MSLQIGINADSGTINGNLLVLDSMLREFQAAGFSHVEIPVHGLDCIINGNLALPCLEKVKRILEKYPFSYTVHAPDALNLEDASNPEVHAAALRATIDFATEIRAGIVVYHGSWIEGPAHRVSTGYADASDRKSVLELWGKEIERLGEIADFARQRGVTVAVENIFRQGTGEKTYRIDPRQLVAVISAVNSPAVGICFDFGHAFISANEGGFSIEEALRAVLPHLVHVHIHDNFGRVSGQNLRPIDTIFQGTGDLHLVPGWGSIPYPRLFPEFAPSYKGVLMMEIQPRFKDFYPAAIAWMTRMIEALPKEAVQ